MLTATLSAVLIGLFSAAVVCANTEIVNFEARESHDIALPPELQWPTLHHGEAKKLWRLQPGPLGTHLEDVCETAAYPAKTCPHELWLVLDLDDAKWRAYSKFTLRISWPASSPADFAIAIYSADTLQTLFRSGNSSARQIIASPPSLARRQFARIRLVDTGIRTPSSASSNTEQAHPDPIPFIVLLEPLCFGVLPASVAGILMFLVALLSFTAVAVVPVINRYISTAAEDARTELANMEMADKKSKSI